MLSGRFQGSGGYAVVDLEATGSSSRRHRIIEVAVVLLDQECAPQGEFSTLIDPEGPVGPTHIHGIEENHVGGAPRFAGIAPRLLGLLRGRVLVGHNVGCDRAFLVAEYARLGVTLPAVPELCTMRMAMSRVPAPRGFSLGACVADAGLGDWAAHTALGDARATARLFAHYAAEAPGGADVPGTLHTAGAANKAAAVDVAAGVEWPTIANMPGVDALWRGRRSADRPDGWSGEMPRRPKGWNDSSQQMVPNVRNGSA
ncbi:3'-5' exonuclease [Streptomyces sp. H10-C2]|uniref:3'-5' exonuclease n=1 Tax=unclassified Streptomyces TaxID=2593676 RepID=UPI0024B94A2C|nr:MULTISPECIES: 3'-5' exonuclease [unclassified Streptomyces]MDJ0341920.1 3'-5' exonuclease [Streptomyces sp. PH10-H1]MDJ0369894.1 3'-5' exonuclease [Streptomyces sp. H10-C2]MDJ0370105.1 3'-5' exonuclease [Streptomyces sp. H10-C2]